MRTTTINVLKLDADVTEVTEVTSESRTHNKEVADADDAAVAADECRLIWTVEDAANGLDRLTIEMGCSARSLLLTTDVTTASSVTGTLLPFSVSSAVEEADGEATMYSRHIDILGSFCVYINPTTLLFPQIGVRLVKDVTAGGVYHVASVGKGRAASATAAADDNKRESYALAA